MSAILGSTQSGVTLPAVTAPAGSACRQPHRQARRSPGNSLTLDAVPRDVVRDRPVGEAPDGGEQIRPPVSAQSAMLGRPASHRRPPEARPVTV